MLVQVCVCEIPFLVLVSVRVFAMLAQVYALEILLNLVCFCVVPLGGHVVVALVYCPWNDSRRHVVDGSEDLIVRHVSCLLSDLHLVVVVASEPVTAVEETNPCHVPFLFAPEDRL